MKRFVSAFSNRRLRAFSHSGRITDRDWRLRIVEAVRNRDSIAAAIEDAERHGTSQSSRMLDSFSARFADLDNVRRSLGQFGSLQRIERSFLRRKQRNLWFLERMSNGGIRELFSFARREDRLQSMGSLSSGQHILTFFLSVVTLRIL